MANELPPTTTTTTITSPPATGASFTTTTAATAAPETYFQTFRSERERKGNIRIPVVQHPTLGEPYVIWTDITDCFPGACRVQYDNVFIPMLRDKRCYRVKPHGIRYHPGIVLDIVYGEKANRRTITNMDHTTVVNSNSNNSYSTATPISERNTTEAPATFAPALPAAPTPNGHHATVTGQLVNGKADPDQSVGHGVATPDEGSLLNMSDDDDLMDHEEDLEDDYDDHEGLDEDEEDSNGHLESETDEKVALEQVNKGVPQQSVAVQPSTPATTVQPVGTKVVEEVQKLAGEITLPNREEISTEVTAVQGPSAAAIAAAEAAIAAAGATGTTKALLVAVQEIASALMSESTQRDLPHKRAPRIGPLLVADLVEHRVKDMIKSRFTWSDLGHSRFFCFLPIIRGPTVTVTKATKTGVTTTTQTVPNYDAKIYSDTKFDFFHICDCGDIPGFENRWFPHWNIKDDEHYIEHHHSRAAAESLSQQQLDLMIPIVGEYVMGVLEILKYGLYIENVLKVPAQASPDSQKRLSLAIKYLESKGIMSCEKYMAEAFSDPETFVSAFSLDGLKPIAPLDKDASRKFEGMLVQHRWEKYDEMNPYRTTAGDTRWVCLAHWYDMSPQKEWVLANKFSNNPASPKSKYDTVQGVFSAELNNIQRTRDFFLLAERLTTTPMFRLMLNWDLAPEEMDEISASLGRLTAAGVLVRVKNTLSSINSGAVLGSGSVLGFGTPYIQLAMAALRNPKIDIFRMIQRLRDDETEYPIYHERDFLKEASLSMDGLAYFSRAAKDGRVKASVKVTDIDRAAKTVRGLAKGLHRFSELCLSIESVWKEVTIKFAAPDSGKPGSEVEDTDYINGDIGTFFEKRQGCDEIKYDCYGMPDNRFIGFRCLTKVRIGFSLATDRAKLRDIIKMNRNLREVDLENITKDDPSQIYESCKALLANHPTIKSFEVRQRHKNKTPSSFEWKHPNDPAKMRVAITCFEGDKVQSMFQKYASVIETLSVEQIQPSDAAVLEKSMRAKKSPMVLRRFSVMDVHLLDPIVIEDLKKIILRSQFEDLTVAGSVLGKRSVPDHEVEAEALLEASKRTGRQGGAGGKNTRNGGGKSNNISNGGGTNGNTTNNSTNNNKSGKNGNKDATMDDMACATVWVDFLMAIRPKLTHLSVWGKGTHLLLKILDSRMPESMDMPLLDELSISGDWEQSLFECRWMEAILQSKSKQAIEASTTAATAAAAAAGLSGTGSVVLTQPIKQLHIMDLTVMPDEWEKMLKYLDFSKITRLDVRQKNAIIHKTYQWFVEALPQGQMKSRCSIAIHDDGTLDGETILAYEEIIRGKACGQNVMIMVNGYHIFT
ncbi:hypothetical protein BGZ96_007972 [Linnemannia gamsii]|uniref:Uncharacterized protein n=1 Tax=Linnemannia gamsii TaxID=64522 RepID=A0ABQ7K004_9FUNG|nr:hypothetical protein BGZ96_007972 [Linnemannia gamsii]